VGNYLHCSRYKIKIFGGKTQMEKTIENAIKLLAERITKDVRADDALKFTQAALNLEHVLSVKTNVETQRKAIS